MVSPPNTLHGWRFICGGMTQAGKAVIDRQEGIKVGASEDDLSDSVSLPALCQIRAYPPPPPTDGEMARGYRAPSGRDFNIGFSLPVYTADASSGLHIGRRCPDVPGRLGGGGRQQAGFVIYRGIAITVSVCKRDGTFFGSVVYSTRIKSDKPGVEKLYGLYFVPRKILHESDAAA